MIVRFEGTKAPKRTRLNSRGSILNSRSSPGHNLEMSLPNAGHRQRLRARLERAGLDALADYEILEFLLGLAIRGRDVKPLARALLKAFGGSLGRLLDAPRADILAVPGAGPAVADALLAARTDALSNPRLVAEYCRARFAGEHQEVVAALLLDSRHRVVKTDPLSRGTIDCAALKERAAALMRQ